VNRVASLAVAVLALALAPSASAAVTSLTPLASYDAGENIVSYYEYLALDCPDVPTCALSQIVATPSRAAHKNVQAVMTGFKLWTARPEKTVGRIVVEVHGAKAGVGMVNLGARGWYVPGSPGLFSFRIEIAVIESTVEGFNMIGFGEACSAQTCPKTVVVPGVAPPHWGFVGFALRNFDSDRPTSPLFAARAELRAQSIDPASGDVTAVFACGTVLKNGGRLGDVSGPCETAWVAIAIRDNNVAGNPPGFPLAPGPTFGTGYGGSGLNVPNPSLSTPALFCIGHPTPSKGFLDTLAGFHLRAGVLNLPSLGPLTYDPARGGSWGLDVSVSGLSFTPGSTGVPGVPHETFSAGLPALQVVGPLGPVLAPVTYTRMNTSLCL
jgi:hypothetical protein